MSKAVGRLLARLRTTLRRGLGRGVGGSPHNISLGRRAENEAAQFLKRQGYDILERNYTSRRGEIDLVALLDGVIVFVEVRSRTAPSQIDPVETVTVGKQRRIVHAAHDYLRARLRGRPCAGLRFDVIAVYYGTDDQSQVKLRHIPGAFDAQ